MTASASIALRQENCELMEIAMVGKLLFEIELKNFSFSSVSDTS